MITPEIAARAHAQAERPGLWWERWDGAGEDLGAHGDGRVLTQDQTDVTIVEELILRVQDDREFAEIAAPWKVSTHGVMPSDRHEAPERPDQLTLVCAQRGGIHSDPLVRAYALAAWGERDVAWHEQPICACGHEADLHPITTPRWLWSAKAGERSRMQIGQRQHRCEVAFTRESRSANTMIGDQEGVWEFHAECQCTFSRERVRELSGPACTCGFAGIPTSREARHNAGGVRDLGLRHHPECEKLAWYRENRLNRLDAVETAFFARQLATLCGHYHLVRGHCSLERGHDGEHAYGTTFAGSSVDLP